MKSQPVAIRKIIQKDNFTFTIEWTDGVENSYRLSDLQRKCPCAGCDQPIVSDDVRAHRIVSVGRYALRIEYTSGCSAGIYDFDFLRNEVCT